MSHSKVDLTRVVRLLLQDSLPTLGERARAELLRLEANYTALAREWVDHGISVADAQRSVDQYLIDGFQQSAHDLFWDTTWPTCPIHLRHPLWFDESQQAWCCQQDGIAVAELGDLAKLRPPAT